MSKKAKRVRKIVRSQPTVSKIQHRTGNVETTTFFEQRIRAKNFQVLETPTSNPLSTQLKTSIKFYCGVLNPLVDLIQKLDSELILKGEVFGKVVNDSRGIHKTLNLGTWTEQGHANCYRTPQTIQIGEDFLSQYSTIWKFVGDVIRKDFPHISQQLEKLAKPLRLFDLFAFLVFNITTIQKEHRDLNDAELCVVIPTSEFKHGELHFPYLNLSFQVNLGDMLVFKSSQLWHGVLNVLGNRRSLVLTTHKTLMMWGMDKENWRFKL